MLKLLLAKKKRDWQKEVDTETTTTFTWQNPMTPEDRNHLRVIFNERGQVESSSRCPVDLVGLAIGRFIYLSSDALTHCCCFFLCFLFFLVLSLSHSN
jgi:hypothetical protein